MCKHYHQHKCFFLSAQAALDVKPILQQETENKIRIEHPTLGM